jgi:transglutaminase-like putative cysteine protease
MILSVRHVTTYRYDRPVRAVIQSHRLHPARFDGQKVLEWSTAIAGAERGGGFRDGAGDWVQGWTVPGPVSEVVVTVTGRVETRDMAGVLRGHKERLPPEVWLRDTPATRADPAMATLAAETLPKGTGLDLAHALAAAVAEAVDYTPGSTEGCTTAAEALAQGRGVCQDHAQILIGCARRRDLPARYVTGYLHSDGEVVAQGLVTRPSQSQSQSQAQGQTQGTATPQASASQSQSQTQGPTHEASHAWAEIWVAGLGWVGFDASNRCCPDARYIRLGSGLDAADAAPIRGVARGDATESLDVTVAIEAQQQ